MNKNILILGGTGFLGKEIAKSLLNEKKFKVYIGDINPSEIENVHYVFTDIFDFNNLDKVLSNIDIVINCTGQITNPIHSCLKQNSIGINNIIDAVNKHAIKLIHLSSVNVYGSSNDDTNEKANLNPENPYSTAKAIAELTIQHRIPSEKYLIIRLSNLFGEEQKKGLISFLLRAYKSNKKKITFNNNGNLRRYYLHYKDASRILVELIHSSDPSKNIFNLIGPQMYTVKELINLFEKKSNKTIPVEYENINPLENLKSINDTYIKNTIHISYNHNLGDFLSSQFEN
jgi:nucleoside-diphosphate-sugar epimerase